MMTMPSSNESAVHVVHIHMGPNLPRYFWDAVRQTRRFHSGAIVCVLPPDEIDHVLVSELDLIVVSNTSFEDGKMIRSVNELSWLNDRYGGGGFWHYAMLRLFVLEALMQRLSLSSCIHIENDVVIYADPDAVAEKLSLQYGARCAVAPLGPSAGCTAAVMYVGSLPVLTDICTEMIRHLESGDEQVRLLLQADMVNEMVLLGVIRQQRPDLLDVLPVAPHQPAYPPSVKRVSKPWTRPFLKLADWVSPKLLDHVPTENLSRYLGELGCLFDAASWGQYVGGTPHGEGPGFCASHHWIGNDLHHHRYAIAWDMDRRGRRVPFITSREAPGVRWPLFNLHVHSKRIADFV